MVRYLETVQKYGETVGHTGENGHEVKGRAKEPRHGLMGAATLVNGKMTCHTVGALNISITGIRPKEQ